MPQSAKLKNLKNYPQLLHSLATQGLDFIFEALAVAALWYAEIFNVLNIYMYSALWHAKKFDALNIYIVLFSIVRYLVYLHEIRHSKTVFWGKIYHFWLVLVPPCL